MAKRTHEILTELEHSGDLKILAESGICQPCIFNYLEIYRYVDSRMRTGGKRANVIYDAGIQFKVCRATIYNSLKIFK